MIAQVMLWGAEVGLIAWSSERGYSTFEYAQDFLQSGIQLAPVQKPLTSGTYRFVGLSRETFRGLPGLLADALPDKFGNSLIDQWLAESGRSPASFSPVERLMYVGQRVMGALEFLPALDAATPDSISLNIEELVELFSTELASREAQRVTLEPDNARNNIEGLEKILAVGTSAGGARAKAIIAWNRDTNDVRSGQVNAGDGYEYWLLKFDGQSRAVVAQPCL
jgi:serine/threonine-protein kinase HipA